MVEDLAWGPLHRLARSGRGFIGDLRKRILVHLRRLAVHARSDDAEALRSRSRQQLAELAKNLRINVLGRATRATQESWTPLEIGAAVERRLGNVPLSVRVPYEAVSYEAQSDDGPWFDLRRRMLGLDRWLRRASGDSGPQRQVELRSFLVHHFLSAELETVEGWLALLIQAEVSLEGRARSVFDLVARTLEQIARGSDAPGAALEALKLQVEEELGLAEEEHQRYIDDLLVRARTSMAAAMRAAKSELVDIGTFRLPQRLRSGARVVEHRARRSAGLNALLEGNRAAASGGHGLLGLRLELVAFSVQVTERLDIEIDDLERSLKGRSLKQLERLHGAIEEVLRQLEETETQDIDGAAMPDILPTDEADAQEESIQTLGGAFEHLSRVLRDAQRAARHLVDLLTSDRALAAPIEAVAREAGRLTDYYQVPERRLAAAEWSLPEPPPFVSLPFRKLVSAFVETDVAPHLLEVTAKGAANFQPMLSALSEVERVAQLGGGQLEGDDALVQEYQAELGETRVVLTEALSEVRTLLEELEPSAAAWSTDLGRDLRTAAKHRLDELRRRFGEEELAQTLAEAPDGSAPPDRIRSELGRLGGWIAGLGLEGRRRVRAAVGEDTLADVRKALGLRASGPGSAFSDPFGPPREQAAVPPFYRRLFAGQASWVGDVLDEHQGAVAAARQSLNLPSGSGPRVIALVGAEGSGRRALLGALSRGDRFGSTRRLTFNRPAEVADVKAALSEVSSGQVAVVTGLRWLVSAQPGGFDALRCLVDGILETEGRSAFILEAQPLVWAWAGAAAPLGELCASEIRVAALEPEPLRDALLERHRLSGLKLSLPSQEGEEAALKRYFHRLHRAADGLLQVALAYWIASIESVDEDSGTVRMGHVPTSPHDALAALPDATLRMLYVIERQGWMTADVLAGIVGRDRLRARAELGRLLRWGLLETGPEGRYWVRRHLQGSLDMVLREREWL